MKNTVPFLGAALLASCALADPTLKIERSEHAVSAEFDGRTLWTLHHDPAEGKPYFHPLAAADGTVFTDLRPKDHPWHRGLWFSWKIINGRNYWEEDKRTHQPVEGHTILLSTEREVCENDGVRIQQRLRYAPAEGAEPLALETREIRVTAPDASGLYSIDWTSEFRAAEQDLVFDRTPIKGEPDGKPYGGYAGLSLRMNKAVRGGTFTNGGRSINKRLHGAPSEWILYESPSGGGILFMDHPGNLRHPQKWYVDTNMPFFGPAVLFDSPHPLPAGESLRLRYRIVVSPTPITRQRAAELWSGWTQAAGK